MFNVLVNRVRAVALEGHSCDELPARTTQLIPEGFVMLFDDNYDPLEPANFFLLDRCCRPKKRKGTWENTQEAYADDLAHWWTYLSLSNTSWDQVSRDDIEEYAGILANVVSPSTSMLLTKSTRRRRIGTPCEFYEWAYEKDYMDHSVLHHNRRNLSTILDTTAGPHSEPNLLPPEDVPSERIHPFEPQELQQVLLRLGPPLLPLSPLLKPIRDRLVAETSLYTGMRLSETLSMTVFQILALASAVDPSDPWKQIALRIRDTKGDRPRTVFMPSFLVAALLRYIDTERAAILAKARETAGKFQTRSHRAPYALFLNGLDSTDRDIGEPVSADTISRSFTKAVKACGLVRREIGSELDPETGVPLISLETGSRIPIEVILAAHTFHDLRHTFALNHYKAELLAGNASPWKKLAARLGHARMSTTMDIYLAHVDDSEPSISDDLAEYHRRKTR